MPGLSEVGTEGRNAEALRRLRELKARTDLSPAELDQEITRVEKAFGWTAAPGKAAAQRLDERLQAMERTSFLPPKSQGLINLDGKSAVSPARAGPAFSEAWMKTATVVVETDNKSTQNVTQIVTLRGAYGRIAKGVFKPRSGEMQGAHGAAGVAGAAWGTLKAGTFYKREIAASRLNDVLGRGSADAEMGDLVAQTVEREVNGEVGSLQLFAEDAKVAYLAPAQPMNRAAVEKARVFDFLIDNIDRHGGNWLFRNVNGEGVPVLIDHGLTLHLRPESGWRFDDNAGGGGWRIEDHLAGSPSPAGPVLASTRQFVAAIDPQKVADVLAQSGIEPEAVRLVLDRLARIKANPDLIAFGNDQIAQELARPVAATPGSELERVLAAAYAKVKPPGGPAR